MSGGIAYVYDGDGTFANRLNDDMVDIDPLEVDDLDFLKETIARHRELTGSAVAARLLDDWRVESRKFAKVMPTDYKRVLEAARIAEEKGLSVDEAIMAAAHG
jgi:glutamate synthase (NADPH/NADH) large chain